MASTVSAVLLDTCALIRLAQEGRRQVKKTTLAILDDLLLTRYISAVSIMEIAQKHNRGRLMMDPQVLEDALYDLSLQVLPYSEGHAKRLFNLPLHHADPIDRMVISTALVEKLPVITSDRNFRLYKGLNVIPL